MVKNYFSLFSALIFSISAAAHSGESTGVEFIKNLGQWEGNFIYRANTANGDIFLQQNGFTYVVGRADNAAKMEAFRHGRIEGETTLYFHAYRVKFEGANQAVVSQGAELETYYNYFLGKDPSRWKSGIHPTTSVDYKGLYDGIDMHIGSEYGSMKYEYMVAPGANPYQIQMSFEGANELSIHRNGDLVIGTSLGDAVEKKPYAYQVVNGVKREVPCVYKIRKQTVSYEFPEDYDHSLPLVIDPTVVFATFTGSAADNFGFTATYDDAGNFYAGGLVSGIGFPVSTGALQVTFGGGSTVNGTLYPCDMGIIKFSPSGNQRIYATYIGGTDNETPHSMIVDQNNNLIIAGRTYSTDYPVTNNVFDPTHNGAADIVVTKLNADATALIASTFIGGPGDDGVNFTAPAFTLGQLKYNYGDDARSEVIIDNQGDVYVAASTRTNGFPTLNATQSNLLGAQDAVVFKLNPTLTNLIWSTYLGGNSEDAAYVLTLDPTQSFVYVAGGTQGNGFPFTAGTLWPGYQGGPADGFICKFQNSGAYTLQRATAIGRTDYDQCYGIQTDGAGNVYAMGQSLGGQFPINNVSYSNANSSQFVIKLDDDLTTNLYSTVFGSGDPTTTNISPVAFLVDTCENVYVSGWGGRLGPFPPSIGFTTGMPVTNDAAQSTTDGADFYFIVFPKNITGLLYATFMGQNNTNGEHVDGGTSRFDRNGVVYQAICGGCGGTTFPTTPGVWSPNNASQNCNLVALKIRFDFLPVEANAEIAGDTTGCAPFTVTLTNDSENGVNYVWDFGDGNTFNGQNPPPHTYTAAGTYVIMLAAENANACNQTHDTDYITIVVDSGGIAADFEFAKVDTCGPFTATFTNTSTYSGNPGSQAWTIFTWNFGDGSPEYTGTTPPIHTFPDTGSYTITLTMTDTSACNPTDTVSKVIQFSTSRVTAGTLGDTLCINQGIVNLPNLSVNATNYLWQFSNGDTSTAQSPSFQFDSAGTYTAYLISGNPATCNKFDTSDIVSILILPQPNADFEYTPNPHERNKPVNFINLSTGTIETSTYAWDFGDNTSSNEKTPPPHMYTRKGTYNVCLSVDNPLPTGASGPSCPDVLCRTIFVDIKPIIDIPTAFTPNGDGVNDILYVRGAAITSLNLKIFNRWGELVFETTTLENDPESGGLRSAGWDGKLRGKEQEMDSYAYVLNATFIDGNKYEDKGNVTLIR